MVTTPVSFLGQSLVQANRLKSLNGTMADLQRQMTTQKKYETYAGFGIDAVNVQRYRMDRSLIDSYNSNITFVSTRMQSMITTMDRMSMGARDLLSAVKTRVGVDDYPSIKTIAEQTMVLTRDLANLEVDGRYLFSGSNTQVPPLASDAAVTTQVDALWTAFKNGTLTAAQVTTNLNALTPTQIGFDPALTSSGAVTARIDDVAVVDYSSVADKNGMQDIYLAIGMLSRLTELNPAVDIPSQDDLDDLLKGVMDLLEQGITTLRDESATLSAKYSLVDATEKRNAEDVALLDKLIAQKENVDTTEVAVQIQALQTQMTASYQITSLMKDLTLVNFL